MNPEDMKGFVLDLAESKGWEIIKAAIAAELKSHQTYRSSYRPGPDAASYAYTMEYERGVIDALEQYVAYPESLLDLLDKPEYVESVYAIWKGSREGVSNRNGSMQKEGEEKLPERLRRRPVPQEGG